MRQNYETSCRIVIGIKVFIVITKYINVCVRVCVARTYCVHFQKGKSGIFIIFSIH